VCAVGPDGDFAQLEDLQTDGWIGVHSKDAAISISLINPNVGLLARAYIYFEFTLGNRCPRVGCHAGVVQSPRGTPQVGLWKPR